MAPTTARKKQLGVAAKATVLVSCLHPKDKVMKAYPNHTKDERTLEIVVSGRDMHLICCEQKLVVIFNHLPQGDVEAGFECWAIQCFIQVTTEGNKEHLFDQEVPVGIIAQEHQQPNTGNENAANNNNNDDDEEDGLTEELHRIANATTTFWEVQQMVDEWNKNMAEQFTPSWVSCLDESMSPWTNKYTCPGWMFVPRKAHPFSNEYHSVCCSTSGIMWGMELVEGKDVSHTAEHPKPKHNNHGNTVSLLLQILEPIFARGSVVVLDSGFCVLKGIIELKKRGVYVSALIKKCRYWPKYIKGDDIKSHLDDKDIGDCDAWKGQMDEVDFHVYTKKEPDYVMLIMSTYRTNQQMGKEMQHELVGGE